MCHSTARNSKFTPLPTQYSKTVSQKDAYFGPLGADKFSFIFLGSDEPILSHGKMIMNDNEMSNILNRQKKKSDLDILLRFSSFTGSEVALSFLKGGHNSRKQSSSGTKFTAIQQITIPTYKSLYRHIIKRLP